MPRIKSAEPPKDYVKAIFLERKLALGLTDEEMSAALRISRQTWSKMINHKHTDEWSMRNIKSVCKLTHVSVEELRSAIKYQ